MPTPPDAAMTLHQFPQPAILLLQCCHPPLQGFVLPVRRCIAVNNLRVNVAGDATGVPELLQNLPYPPGHPPGSQQFTSVR